MVVSARNLPRLERHGEGRLGLDQPGGSWPTIQRLKSYEAAGFQYIQVRMPPRVLLAYDPLVALHARALRDALGLTGLRLILHAPNDLLAGSDEHDRQLEGAITYAAIAGADLVVYHGARHEISRGDVRRRLADEEQSLRGLVRLAERRGVRIAIENPAPVYVGPERVCHNLRALDELVRRLDSEHAGICLDLGHAHIAAGLAGRGLLELVEPALDRVLVFHVHDNYGADGRARRAATIEPIRLDLHLVPGAGTIPWGALAPLLAAHRAPLQLEVHSSQRPEPATLAIRTSELLGLGVGAGIA